MKLVFGAHGQVVVGVVTVLGAVVLWAWYSLPGHAPTVKTVFHISMYFGVVACYSIVSGALGYRATERVETAVVETAANVTVTE